MSQSQFISVDEFDFKVLHFVSDEPSLRGLMLKADSHVSGCRMRSESGL